jgi:hypothetical protein
MFINFYQFVKHLLMLPVVLEHACFGDKAATNRRLLLHFLQEMFNNNNNQAF